MKRLVVTMFAVVLMFTLCSSSVFAGGLTGKGLKAGLNFANFHGDDTEGMTFNSKMGLCAGGFITYSINDVFAIQPEVLYTMKGTKWDTGYGATITYSVNYLEIPVLVRLSIASQGSVVPSLFVGPYVAIKLSSKAKIEPEGGGGSVELDWGEDIKTTDFGVVVGAGVDFSLFSMPVTVDARYTLGLTSMYDSPDDLKNGVISVMLGLSI